MKLSFNNMMLEFNVFDVCKRLHSKEGDGSENNDIQLIKPIIKEHIQDGNFIKGNYHSYTL